MGVSVMLNASASPRVVTKVHLDLALLEVPELVLHEALQVLVHELKDEEELAVFLEAVEQPERPDPRLSSAQLAPTTRST